MDSIVSNIPFICFDYGLGNLIMISSYNFNGFIISSLFSCSNRLEVMIGLVCLGYVSGSSTHVKPKVVERNWRWLNGEIDSSEGHSLWFYLLSSSVVDHL